MKASFKNYFTAAFILAGTILGVGIFGLPYVFSKSGFLTGLFFLFFCGALVTINHLIYGEILLRTPGEHRLPGLAKIYLGKLGFSLTSISAIVSAVSVLLAYLILGGQFFSNFGQALNHPIGINLATIIFWIIGTIGFSFGIGLVGFGAILGVVLILIFIIGFFILGIPHVQWEMLTRINFSQFLLPYGVLLFSLSDGSAVPEILSYFTKKGINKEKIDFKKPIIGGTFLPPILYILFILGVFGLFQGKVVPIDLIPGLLRYNPIVGLITNFLGIILILTSYFVIGLSLRNTLCLDLKIKGWMGWLIPTILPIALYFFGFQDFIGVISFIGAVILGIIITTTIIIHKKSQEKGGLIPSYQIKIPGLARITLIILLLLGVGLEIAKFF
jgi:tyrosine-specific transport protein